MEKLLTWTFLLLLLVTSASGQIEIFSGEANPDSRYITVNESGIAAFSNTGSRSVHMNITESERKIDSLSTYKSYILEAEDVNVIHLNLKLERKELKSWMTENKIQSDRIAILTSDNAYIDIDEETFTSEITVAKEKTEITIVGSPDITEDLSLAVHPDKTTCRLYWNPTPNYTKVDNCEGKLELGASLGDKIPLILLVLFILLLFSGLLYLRRNDNDDIEGIESITEEIIDDMENGDIPKDKDLLEKLQEANRKAYKDQYEEASKILNQVKSELDSKKM